MIQQTATGFKVTVAAPAAANNRFIPDFVENPYKDLTAAINEFNITTTETLEAIGYWINPKNLFTEAWQGLEWLMLNPATGHFLIGGTIVGIWLIMFGANWPKRYVFWGWVSYWGLRVMFFG